MNLGIAFQLIDDVLDYGGTSAALGKNVATISREGKITLPIVLALRRATDEERVFWRRTLEREELEEATSNRRSRSCAATGRSRTRWTAPAITATPPAHRSISSPTAR